MRHYADAKHLNRLVRCFFVNSTFFAVKNHAAPDRKSITEDPSFPRPEHFYMVSQVRWEDDIIWNADDVRHKLGKVLLLP